MESAEIVTSLITGEELEAMGEIGPCELVDGRIVPMRPTGGRHGIIEFRLSSALGRFIEEHNHGWVLTGEVGLYTRRNPDRVRGADIVVLAKARYPDGPPEGFLQASPELVIEIMSPHDRWQEVRQKLAEYFEIGVSQVWIVEPQNHTVVVFRSNRDLQEFGLDDTLSGEGMFEGFTLAITNLFTI